MKNIFIGLILLLAVHSFAASKISKESDSDELLSLARKTFKNPTIRDVDDVTMEMIKTLKFEDLLALIKKTTEVLAKENLMNVDEIKAFHENIKREKMSKTYK